MTDVVLGRNIFIGALPLADVTDLIEDEYALSLAFGSLHSEICTGFMIHNIFSLFCLLNYS